MEKISPLKKPEEVEFGRGKDGEVVISRCAKARQMLPMRMMVMAMEGSTLRRSSPTMDGERL